MLSSRYELSRLCGYPTFAHRAVLESMGQNPENVNDFLCQLSKRLQETVKSDHFTMFNMKKRENPLAQSLQVWDIPYFTRIAKNSWISDVNLDHLSEYFSLGVCMEGLNMIFESMFGVTLVVENPESGEVWHPDVYKIGVMDDNGLLGHIYCDFFTRTGKSYQDCHFTIRGGRETKSGEYQNPIVVLMLNLPSPSWTRPTLLTPSMVDNLFHEMGHALHSMLARTKYQHVTGTRCSTDFAEVPSTLMEYFASDPRVLMKIGKHYKTGESLPLEIIEKFVATKKIFVGVELQTQLFYSLLDQKYHSTHPLNGTTTDVLEQCFNEHHNLKYHPETAWQLRFSHLIGYGARYYSYLMAKSVASTIWQNCFDQNPFDAEAGNKYRTECLAHGGGKPSHKLVSDFLDTPVTSNLLVDAIMNDIYSKNESLKRVLK